MAQRIPFLRPVGPQAYWALRMLFLVMSCVGAVAAQNPSILSDLPLPLLTTAQAVRLLPTEEAAKGYPVRLRGVITYHEPLKYLTFVQDETAASYVAVDTGDDRSSGVAVGQLVEIKGVTSPGKFAPFVGGVNGRKVEVKILGLGTPPKPVELSTRQLSDPRHHSQWVEMRGIVRSVKLGSGGEDSGRLALELTTLNGSFRALLPYTAPGLPPWANWEDAEVRVCGVYGSIFNEKRQLIGMKLFVPTKENVEVLRMPESTDPFALPVKPVIKLMAFGSGDAIEHRVRVQGVVTLVEPGGLVFIRGETGALQIRTRQAPSVSPGDKVDVSGFPATGDCNPVLEDAVIRTLGRVQSPEAVPFDPVGGFGSRQDAELVSIEALLEDQVTVEGRRTLNLQAGGRTFAASFAPPAANTFNIPAGSRVRVTGVCLVRSDKERVPESFRLLLRSVGDVALLQRAPFWTAKRLLWMAAAIGVVLLMVLWWTIVLSRKNAALRNEIHERQQAQRALQQAHAELEQRVLERTRQLSDVNDALKKQIAERKSAEARLVAVQIQHLLEIERARIARDIHDDLGSRLTQIKLLSELTETRSQDREAVETQTRRIASIAQETTQSMDEIVWAMDPRNDTLESLLSYLCKFALDYLGTADIRCRLDAPTQFPELPVPSDLRHHLFLVFKEALNNIVKHSAATEARIKLGIEAGVFAVQIEDDGRGQPATSARNGNGLGNMRRRMEEAGGTFSIVSHEGRGTRIEWSVSLHKADSADLLPAVPNTGD